MFLPSVRVMTLVWRKLEMTSILYFLNVYLFPVRSYFWLETTGFRESNAGSFRAGSQVLCEVWTVFLELKS